MMEKIEAFTDRIEAKDNLERKAIETSYCPSEPQDAVANKTTKRAEKAQDILSISIFKTFKIRICKPLILLKIALFLWYGAASAPAIFLMVYYKKKGITLAELSTIYVISPAVNLVGPTISGIVADKIGRPKPVLVANIMLTCFIVIGMLLSPSLTQPNCKGPTVKLDCDSLKSGRIISQTVCGASRNVTELVSCNASCSRNISSDCDKDDLLCKLLESDELGNFSVTVELNHAHELKSNCYHNFTKISYKNASYLLCSDALVASCDIDCTMDQDICEDEDGSRELALVLNTVLLVLFHTMFSNTYRFMDVTTMFLVKEHDCDFGVQRAFAVIGILVFSPLTGALVDASTAEGSEKNYEAALYFFVAMALLLLAVVYKLEVRIKPPGQNMWRKSFFLLKNPDVIAFAVVLTVLGTAWSFNKNFLFWYLESMDSPSFLLGMVNSISALYGLPFLFFAQWWVRKIGTTNIFLLGLLGYVTSGVGYSLIYDPQLALLIELSNVFTYHLLWVAAVEYSHSIAPVGLVATVISTAGGIHFSIGRGTGGLIGGRVMSAFGGRVAFRVIALMCFITGVLYAIYLFARKVWLKKNKSLEITNGVQNSAFESEDKGKESYVMKSKS